MRYGPAACYEGGGCRRRGQLRLLVKLQELELAIKQFEAAIAAKPHELDPLTRALDDAGTSATTHRKDLEALDKQRRQLEAAVTEEQYNLQKAQRKLLEVKPTKSILPWWQRSRPSSRRSLAMKMRCYTSWS